MVFRRETRPLRTYQESQVKRDNSLDAFRNHVKLATEKKENVVLVVQYNRAALDQTGSGHFSPIGGYHEASDRVLIMDVARFKYPPHWVKLERLYKAMQDMDSETQKPRGWMLVRSRDHLQKNSPSLFQLRGSCWTLDKPTFGAFYKELHKILNQGSAGERDFCLVPQKLDETVQVLSNFFDQMPKKLFDELTIITEVLSSEEIGKERMSKIEHILKDLKETMAYDLISHHVKVPTDMSQDSDMCMKATLVLLCCPSEVWEKIFGGS